MSGNIPFAQPYAWDDVKSIEESQAAIRSLRKRKFVGSGIAVLREDSKKMGRVAQNILTNLFHEHGIDNDQEVVPTNGNEESESHANRFRRETMPDVDDAIPKEDSTDEEILRNAGEGKYSLFLALVKAIDTSHSPVPSMLLVRKTCLVLSSGTVPGSCDSRDMVLAALHFLSTKYATQSDDLLQLPLIRPVNAYGDLEKRNFVKNGTWKLDDIKEKVLKLEDIFLNSPSSWKWLKRETACPRSLTKEEEKSFYLTGTIPDSVNPRKPTTGGNRKRRSTSPSSSLTNKKQVETPASSTIIAEASIDDAETSEDDDELVVEATIIEE